MSSRQFTNVCFRWKPEDMNDDDEINSLNYNIRQKLISNGNFMISSAQLGAHLILRPVVAHTTIQKTTLDSLLIEIEKIVTEIKK